VFGTTLTHVIRFPRSTRKLLARFRHSGFRRRCFYWSGGPCERPAPLTADLGSRRIDNRDCRMLGGRGGRSSKSPLTRPFL